jgi:acetyl esterase/lipase
MTEFNPDYVAAHPFKFALTITEYGIRAFLLSIRRFINPFASQPTTYVTALKSLLLRTVLARDHQFIYSTPKSAYDGTRRIDGNGWEAYEVAADPGRLLQDYHAVVLYFHGGGYIIGDPLVYHSTYRRWKAKASRRGLRLALVPLRYRESPYPIPKFTIDNRQP